MFIDNLIDMIFTTKKENANICIQEIFNHTRLQYSSY